MIFKEDLSFEIVRWGGGVLMGLAQEALVQCPNPVVFDGTAQQQYPVERVEQEGLKGWFGRKMIYFLYFAFGIVKERKLAIVGMLQYFQFFVVTYPGNEYDIDGISESIHLLFQFFPGGQLQPTFCAATCIDVIQNLVFTELKVRQDGIPTLHLQKQGIGENDFFVFPFLDDPGNFLAARLTTDE